MEHRRHRKSAPPLERGSRIVGRGKALAMGYWTFRRPFGWPPWSSV